ncbi:MAG: CRISPR-associated endonuclease Cas1, partial [Desulfurococcaceae archaeon]
LNSPSLLRANSASSLDQLVIATGGAWMSSKLVRTLIEHGVNLVFLDPRGKPVGRVYPPYVSRTVETRRAQYAAYGTSRGVHIMRKVAYSKVSNQAAALRKYYYNTRIEELREAASKIAAIALKASEVDSPFERAREEVLLLEAARLYWPSSALLVPRAGLRRGRPGLWRPRQHPPELRRVGQRGNGVRYELGYHGH